MFAFGVGLLVGSVGTLAVCLLLAWRSARGDRARLLAVMAWADLTVRTRAAGRLVKGPEAIQ